jgi:phosphatidylethanolamine/phosphatidyl-N-methylethanolamine N-methyltransferase
MDFFEQMEITLSQQNLKVLNQTAFELIKDSQMAWEAIDFGKASLWLAVFTVVLSPLYWTIVARNELHNRTLTTFFGTKELGCTVFSLSVFVLGLIRDYAFNLAIKDQPRGPEAFSLMALPEFVAFSYICTTIGSIFVGFSMYELGIHGTYYGDHFGIFKPQRVIQFPFNVCNNPMYIGSSMCFLGTAGNLIAKQSLVLLPNGNFAFRLGLSRLQTHGGSFGSKFYR